jgi:hypothetical protein
LNVRRKTEFNHNKIMDMVSRKQNRLLEKARKAETTYQRHHTTQRGKLVTAGISQITPASRHHRKSLNTRIRLSAPVTRGIIFRNERQTTDWSWCQLASHCLSSMRPCSLCLRLDVAKVIPMLAFRTYSPLIAVMVLLKLPMIFYYLAVHVRH